MSPTLLVLAAGIGSRYGGLKQIDPVGPNGETIIDYSIYDAIRSGFGKLVFVIRCDMDAEFRALIEQKLQNRLPVEYVYQELSMLPAPFPAPPTRKKPWGTGHAVLVAETVIDSPFAVINADDFYGAHSFQVLSDYLKAVAAGEVTNYAMVGFVLCNTLSEFGTVARGVCRVNDQYFLEQVVEITNITKEGRQAKYIDDATGEVKQLSGDEIVSMNMWGFTPSIFDHLRHQFTEFLQQYGLAEKSEFYIPAVVNQLVLTDQAQVKVLKSRDSWFGVTYKEDKPQVRRNIENLIAQGVYPAKLWG